MNRTRCRQLFTLLVTALLLDFSPGVTLAETLNPDAANPHSESPRKRITLEQKKAAAQARKKKQREGTARKPEDRSTGPEGVAPLPRQAVPAAVR